MPPECGVCGKGYWKDNPCDCKFEPNPPLPSGTPAPKQVRVDAEDLEFERQALHGRTWASNKPKGRGWRSMESAPRDGTAIEIACCWGVEPWYGVFRWDDKYTIRGQAYTDSRGFAWRGVPDSSRGLLSESVCYWRPARSGNSTPAHEERPWWKFWLRSSRQETTG